MTDSISDLLRNRMQPGGLRDVYWGVATLALSISVVLGYCVIAFKWFFQFKLSERAAARAALARLRMIVACCALLGVIFVALNLTRFVWMWGVYDLMLLLLLCYTWVFGVRMRGVRLIDDRLARVSELEQSVVRYRELAELLPHMVWTADEKGRVDYCNRICAAYTGEGRSWLDVVHEQEAPLVAAAWREAVRGRAPFEREVRLGANGRVRTFAVRAVPVFHDGAVKWLGACADIEDQKRLATEQEAQAKQKAFFLNALSHDLRAPLTNITLNAHLLKSSARDPEETELIKTIGENALAAGQLLSTLLEFAKAGHEASVIERVSIMSVLHQVQRRFLPHAKQKGLDLRVIREEHDLICHTDRHKLERIIGNLVENAVKYTRRGRVELWTAVAGERAAVYVGDTGGGVPRESAPFLFEEFFQADNPARDHSKGFGLGLAICKSLARQLGGDVRLVNTGPEGSCFEVTVRDEHASLVQSQPRDDLGPVEPAPAELCPG
jgi:PAS domain S-box-containing protein